MDFLVDFLKAVFIERDKDKIKDSITVIALVIIAGFLWNLYSKMDDTIKTNSDKITRFSNYKVVVINVTDSIFTVKGNEIISNTNKELGTVLSLVHNLDEKRRQEIDYLAKYKDKSYQEIMDVLKINEKRWEYDVDRKEIYEPKPLLMESLYMEVEKAAITVPDEKISLEMKSVEPKLTISKIDSIYTEKTIVDTITDNKKKFFLFRLFSK
jgi:hypothetical protein